MDAKAYLKHYQEKADALFEKFFNQKAKEAARVDTFAVKAIRNLERYVKGGKKARGALTLLAYQALEGNFKAKIMQASIAVELMHNGLLIHDDFIDNDSLRRGKPTIHEIYSIDKEPHYGASVAVMVGDLGIFLSQQLLLDCGFRDQLVRKALYEFNHLLVNTGYGEILDVAFDYKKKVGWQDIYKVRIYKTAHYTFVMPLVVGAILAGASSKVINTIRRYAEPVGLAFQLQDDVLGSFGDPKIMGKSNELDIREGKKTLLYVKALEMANRADRQYLKKWYGSRKLDRSKIKKIKNIIKSSGALSYSQQEAKRLTAKGKKHITGITGVKKYQAILSSFADYMIERKR